MDTVIKANLNFNLYIEIHWYPVIAFEPGKCISHFKSATLIEVVLYPNWPFCVTFIIQPFLCHFFSFSFGFPKNYHSVTKRWNRCVSKGVSVCGGGGGLYVLWVSVWGEQVLEGGGMSYNHVH